MTAERDDAGPARPAGCADPITAGPRNTGGPRADRGSATLYIVIFTIAAFALVGLLVDGGTAISAKERAADIAGQAARAVANHILASSLRSGGQPKIDPAACPGVAASLVQAYQTSGHMRAGLAGNGCTIGPAPGGPAGAQEATVTVEVSTTPVIPGFFPPFTETARATAEPECGITHGQPC